MAYLKRDMLSINTRNLIAQYFADLTLVVDSIESYRNTLAEIPDFDIISLFRFIDREEKGYLSVSDFQWLITDKSKKLLHYAFSWFDSSKVGQITRLEFVDFLLPRQNSIFKQKIEIALTAPKHPSYIPPTLPYQIDILKALIIEIITKQTKLIPLRRQIMSQDDYSIQAVMNSIDNDRNDYICVSDLYKFMKNYDIDVKHYHMKELLCNYDSDMNGKISLSELGNLIQGLENKSSEYRKILRRKVNKKNVSASKEKKKIKTQETPAKPNKKAIQPIFYTNIKKGHRNKENNISFARQSISQDKNIAQFSQNDQQSMISHGLQLLKKNFQLMQQKAETIDSELVKLGTQLEQTAKKQFQEHLGQIVLKKKIEKQAIVKIQEQQRERILLIKQKEELQKRKRELQEQQKRQIIEQQLNHNIRQHVQLKWATEEKKISEETQRLLDLSKIQQNEAMRSYIENKFRCSSSIDMHHYERSLSKLNKYLVQDDPLGIKSHLEQTDKYLLRSRELREKIKEERMNERQIQDYIKARERPVGSFSAHKGHSSLRDSDWSRSAARSSNLRNSLLKPYNFYERTAVSKSPNNFA